MVKSPWAIVVYSFYNAPAIGSDGARMHANFNLATLDQ